MPKTVRVPEAFAHIFQQAQQYVQRHFEAIRFEPEKGTIGVGDQRYVLVRASALSVEFFDVVRGLYGDKQDQGSEVARELLFDVAHAMGLTDAHVLAQKQGVVAPIERLAAGPIHFAYAGWASVDIHPDSHPSPDDEYVLYFDHPYSMEADAWLSAGHTADFPVCVMNAGYSSGWCESSFGFPLVSAEITCRAKGDAQCRFIMAPPQRIEARIAEYRERHPDVVRDTAAISVPGFFRRKTSSESLLARAELLASENAELERRVAERTDALVRTNEALSRELAERREAEAALRESEELNRRILEAVPSGIVHVSADGAIRSANAQAQDILGLGYDELTRRYTSDFAHETIWETGEPALPEDYPVSRVLSTGAPQGPVTLGVSRPDGSVSWAIFRAFPVYDPGTAELSGAIVTFVDITQRKADEELRRGLQEQIQRTQKLESLGLLAGGIAHDFNNLLVGILGNATWLARGCEPGSREWEATANIVTAGRRAADLTKQMLAYAGRARIEAEQVDVRTVLREMHELLRSSLAQRVVVEYVLPEQPLSVNADTAQLAQVVMNLITNACEAAHERHPEAGHVRVEASLRTLGHAALQAMYEHERCVAGEFVCISVRDDGEGLAPDVLPRVFDPFFTTKEQGHGLGLAAVLGIIRAHGGALDIETQLGAGTAFRVYLPAVSHAHVAAPSQGGAPVVGRPLSGLFLVVDDEPVVRVTATAILERLGFTVLQAADGEEGLAAYRAQRGLVRGMLLDLSMPVLDGLGVLRQVRALDPALPIVLCSGYDRHEVVAGLPPDARFVFLPKPFTAEALEEAVRSLLT